MLYSIVGIIVIILDQLVKYWVDVNITSGGDIRPLIPGIVSLVRVQNDGAAFSFLAGGGARIWFIIITAVFALLVVLALATNFISGRFGRWCLVFITAGGLANMIDRVRYGFVLDMFKVELFDFAVFNVADIFITVFCIAFILYILFGGEKELEDDADEFDERDYEEEDRPVRESKRKRSRYSPEYADDEDEEPVPVAPKRRKAERAAVEDEDDYPQKKAPAKRRRADFEEDEEFAPRPAPTRSRRSDDSEESARPAKPSARQTVDAYDELMSGRNRASARSAVSSAAQDERFAEMFSAQPASSRAQQQPQRRPSSASAPSPRQQTRPAARATDFEDPFAEWEKANVRARDTLEGSSTSQAMGYSRPAAPQQYDLFSETEAAPRRPVRQEPVYERPSAPAQRKPEPKPQSSSFDEFDLDSILNEFK